jgi:hypothetical protein
VNKQIIRSLLPTALKIILSLGCQIRGSVTAVASKYVNSSPTVVNMAARLCYCLYMLKVNKDIYVLLLFQQEE